MPSPLNTNVIAMHAPASPVEASMAFGRFRLVPARRLLLDAGAPVALGGRALDLLLVLAEHAGEVVRKEDLIASVWPDTVVEETNLRVHVAALRRVLGDAAGGAPIIRNVPGRGYCLATPVVRTAAPQAEKPAGLMAAQHLPGRGTRPIGLADRVQTLVEQSSRHRLVTIVGPGGVGKSVAAVALAQARLAIDPHSVCFVDLACQCDPEGVHEAVSRALGVAQAPGSATSIAFAGLAERQLLVVLDHCDDVIDAAAEVAIALVEAGPRMHVVATSREPLRVEDEWLYRLDPLPVPALALEYEAAEWMALPSVELFVERAAACAPGFRPCDADVVVIGEICRRLDGMPLAIELAALQVAALGVRGVLAQIADGTGLLSWRRRAGAPRQRSLRASLDASWEHLSNPARSLLCHLSRLRPGFTPEAASAAGAHAQMDAGATSQALAELVEQSLVMADLGESAPRYRLLETTRACAAEKQPALPPSQPPRSVVRLAFDRSPDAPGVMAAGWPCERRRSGHAPLP